MLNIKNDVEVLTVHKNKGSTGTFQKVLNLSSLSLTVYTTTLLHYYHQCDATFPTRRVTAGCWSLSLLTSGKGEEAGIPGENPHRHRENMETCGKVHRLRIIFE